MLGTFHTKLRGVHLRGQEFTGGIQLPLNALCTGMAIANFTQTADTGPRQVVRSRHMAQDALFVKVYRSNTHTQTERVYV